MEVPVKCIEAAFLLLNWDRIAKSCSWPCTLRHGIVVLGGPSWHSLQYDISIVNRFAKCILHLITCIFLLHIHSHLRLLSSWSLFVWISRSPKNAELSGLSIDNANLSFSSLSHHQRNQLHPRPLQSSKLHWPKNTAFHGSLHNENDEKLPGNVGAWSFAMQYIPAKIFSGKTLTEQIQRGLNACEKKVQTCLCTCQKWLYDYTFRNLRGVLKRLCHRTFRMVLQQKW